MRIYEISRNRTRAFGLTSPPRCGPIHPSAPGQFTAALMRAAEAQGAELRLGRVTGITQYEGRATGVEVDGNVVEGDAMVIAMGPWSILAACWLPLPAVFGLKATGSFSDTGAKIPAEASFLEYQEQSGAVLTPNSFPAPTAQRMSVPSPARSPCRLTRPGLPRTPARSRGWRRCAARCRRSSPRRRSSRGRRAIARSLGTGCR